MYVRYDTVSGRSVAAEGSFDVGGPDDLGGGASTQIRGTYRIE